MGKPKRKYKNHKNKIQLRDNFLEETEARSFFDYDESFNNALPKQSIDKLIHANYSKTPCEWFTQKEYKDIIYNYINEKKISSGLEFSIIFKTGLDLSWNFKQMDVKLDKISAFFIKNESTSYKSSEEDICLICQEQKQEFYSLECSHKFCLECYREYIRTLLKENGPAMVNKTCPMQGCKVKKK